MRAVIRKARTRYSPARAVPLGETAAQEPDGPVPFTANPVEQRERVVEEPERAHELAAPPVKSQERAGSAAERPGTRSELPESGTMHPVPESTGAAHRAIRVDA